MCFLEDVKPTRFISKSRIDGSYFVTTFPKVTNVLLNAVLRKTQCSCSSLLNAKIKFRSEM